MFALKTQMTQFQAGEEEGEVIISKDDIISKQSKKIQKHKEQSKIRNKKQRSSSRSLSSYKSKSEKSSKSSSSSKSIKVIYPNKESLKNHKNVQNIIYNNSKKVCMEHVKGKCKLANQCQYSHDLSRLPCPELNFFGYCSIKKSCQYQHKLLQEKHKLRELMSQHIEYLKQITQGPNVVNLRKEIQSEFPNWMKENKQTKTPFIHIQTEKKQEKQIPQHPQVSQSLQAQNQRRFDYNNTLYVPIKLPSANNNQNNNENNLTTQSQLPFFQPIQFQSIQQPQNESQRYLQPSANQGQLSSHLNLLSIQQNNCNDSVLQEFSKVVETDNSVNSVTQFLINNVADRLKVHLDKLTDKVSVIRFLKDSLIKNEINQESFSAILEREPQKFQILQLVKLCDLDIKQNMKKLSFEIMKCFLDQSKENEENQLLLQKYMDTDITQLTSRYSYQPDQNLAQFSNLYSQNQSYQTQLLAKTQQMYQRGQQETQVNQKTSWTSDDKQVQSKTQTYSNNK